MTQTNSADDFKQPDHSSYEGSKNKLGVCPHCGYCPTCGRPYQQFNYPQTVPVHPWDPIVYCHNSVPQNNGLTC